MPNITSQVQSLLDIIEFILNKLDTANIVDLKNVLEESLNEIVVIKNNLHNFNNSNNSEKKGDDIYLKFIAEENNIFEKDKAIAKQEPIIIPFVENNVEPTDEPIVDSFDEVNEEPVVEIEPIILPIDKKDVEPIDEQIAESFDEACEKSNAEPQQVKPIEANVEDKYEEIENSPLYVCPDSNCGKSFKKVFGETGFIKHMESDHGFKREDLKCPMPLCSRRLSCKQSLTHHIKTVHNQNLDLECKICLKEFSNNQIYHMHMNSYHRERKKKKGHKNRNKILSCAACSYVTNNEEEMVRHKFEDHGIERKTKTYDIAITCEFCGFWKEGVDKDQHVLENHVIDGKFHCPKCNFIAEDENSLLKHSNTEHKVKACLYQCPDIDCGKQFKTVKGIIGLVRHMENVHYFNFKESPKCPICLKKSKDRESLKQHISSFHSNMDLQCKKCFKILVSSDGLRHHMLHQHTNLVETLVCNECGYSTKNKTAMKKHKAIKHSTEGKQISCQLCPARFYFKFDLNAHMRNVHAEKNFLCTQCEFSTRLKGNLDKHIEAVHGSQERNFSCHICGNKFRDEKQCKKHLELHSGKKYKCEYCGKEFAFV